MSGDDKVAAAQAEVDQARERLIDSVRDVAAQFEPRKLVREMWEGAKVKGADFAEDAVDAVKKRPVAVGGALAALTMFLAREPIKDGVSTFYDAINKRKKTPKAKAEGNSPARSKVQEKKTAAGAKKMPVRPERPRGPRKPAAPKVEKAS